MSFYVNEKTKVIHKFRAGKIYQNTLETAGIKELEQNLPGSSITLTYLQDDRFFPLPEHPTAKPQRAGKICWYGAFKSEYFGPFFQGKRRQIEKIVSDYHKTCKQLEQLKTEENSFVDWFNDQLSLNNIQEAAPHISKDKVFASLLLQKHSFPANSTVPSLLQDFLECEIESDLTYFILNRQGKAIIAAAIEVSKQLHFDVVKAVSDVLQENNIGMSQQEMSPDELASYYDRSIIQHIWQFHYTPSSWHPAKGFEPLLDELRTGYFLAEIDYNLIKQFTTNPTLQFASAINEGYLVYEVAPTEVEEAGEDTHIIKIIGAESDNGGYLYFIDPNDASSPGQPRVVHRISKDLFYHVLLDVHGTSVENSMTATTFPPVLHRSKKGSDDPIASHSPKRIPKRQHSPKLGLHNLSNESNDVGQANSDVKQSNSPRLFRATKQKKIDTVTIQNFLP
ncbi:hypothetical protein [Legionella brunensis]|uniref:Uncharacterized protein n=1 Tax=Legionella brunensis TaxID=29422 RepID=A0A0W0SDR4_9GAMM|nr:hypothetical protein [Legionella brunensis]KTC81612.1 hypothetical protein Lbru_2132 [Legionella brunensis]